MPGQVGQERSTGAVWNMHGGISNRLCFLDTTATLAKPPVRSSVMEQWSLLMSCAVGNIPRSDLVPELPQSWL